MTTKDRRAGLTSIQICNAIHDEWRALHKSSDFEFHCGTVMPDHIHLLFTLGERLELDRLVAKFKAKTRDALLIGQVEWQSNYFDHRLRPDIPMEAYTRYIFLNPYRKGLLSLEEEWPGWVLNRNYRPELLEQLREEKYPQQEWLMNEVSIDELIQSSVGP